MSTTTLSDSTPCHASPNPLGRDEVKEKATQPSDIEIGLPTNFNVDAARSSNFPDELEDNSNVPHLSVLQIFWLFFNHLVVMDQWITLARFNRVLAVYQVLPGPEAAEMCIFFGCLAGGRLGGVAAGLGFILPGFFLMLVASYLYVIIGFGNMYVDASFRALQPMVAAMILRGTYKIAEHVMISHESKKPNPWLFAFAILTALNSALRINWCISLGVYGLINVAITRRFLPIAGLLFVFQYICYALYVVFQGVPSTVSLALGISRIPDTVHLFILGLVAGSLSFGGVYAAIPFVHAEAVLFGRWLPQHLFVDCIAISNILPAPLVIFATFIGFHGGYVHAGTAHGFTGATVITIGMFLPCFLFTIIGHHLLEKLVRNQSLSAFFDGICGSVVGVVAIVAINILRGSVGNTGRIQATTVEGGLTVASRDAVTAVLYMVTLAVLYKFTHKYTAIVLVVCGALAGQFLFV